MDFSCTKTQSIFFQIEISFEIDYTQKMENHSIILILRKPLPLCDKSSRRQTKGFMKTILTINLSHHCKIFCKIHINHFFAHFRISPISRFRFLAFHTPQWIRRQRITKPLMESFSWKLCNIALCHLSNFSTW